MIYDVSRLSMALLKTQFAKPCPGIQVATFGDTAIRALLGQILYQHPPLAFANACNTLVM